MSNLCLLGGGPSASGATNLGNPTAVKQNTSATLDLGADGYSWAQAYPLTIDKFGKLITIVQKYNAGGPKHKFCFSNDQGATWFDGGFFLDNSIPHQRASVAYDPEGDRLHVLWISNDGATWYEYYEINRDILGDDIIDVVGLTQPNFAIDTVSNTITGSLGGHAAWPNGVSIGFPVAIHAIIPGRLDTDGNPTSTYGSILCFWVINDDVTGKAEARFSILDIRNDATDKTLHNWAAPMPGLANETPFITATGVDDPDNPGTPLPGTQHMTPRVPYGWVFTAQGHCAIGAAVIAVGQATSDVAVVGFDAGNGRVIYRQVRFNAANKDWRDGVGAILAVSDVVVSHIDGSYDPGYPLKGELITKPTHDPGNDRVYFGFARWPSDTLGDTWSFCYVQLGRDISNVRTQTLSALVNVFSVGPMSGGELASGLKAQHSYAPCGDVFFDPNLGLAVVTYIVSDRRTLAARTSHLDGQEYAYLKTYNGVSPSQGATAIFTTEPVDIPVVCHTRVNEKLALVFRNSIGSGNFSDAFAFNPNTYNAGNWYDGWFVTMDFTD